MTNLRTLIAASAIAIAAATGSAVAAPALNANVAIDSTTGISVEQASHFGGFGYGRLCYVPFFVLAQKFGFWQARMIKQRCRWNQYGYGYNNYGYNNGYGY